MKKLPLIASSLVLGVVFFISATASFGKPEYTKKEKKACTACHVSAKSKDLNDTGKCYHEKKDLKACAK
jgi:hypothetical protein